MSDTTSGHDKNDGSFGDFVGTMASDEIGFFFVLPIIAGWIGCVVLVAAGSAMFYPLAWLLGFKPRRWWAKEDNFHWSHFLRNAGIIAFLILLAICGAIVFTTK